MCGIKMSECCLKKTHHKHQFAHIRPGEVVQQLPDGAHVLQHRGSDRKSQTWERRSFKHVNCYN